MSKAIKLTASFNVSLLLQTMMLRRERIDNTLPKAFVK